MKKLLAMVLVLGMASFASAALTLSGTEAQMLPGTYTLSVSADDAANVDFGIGLNVPSFDAGIADLVNPVEGPATGDAYAATDYRPAGYAAWFISSQTSGQGELCTAGDRVYIDLVVSGVAGDTFDVILYDDGLNVLDTQSVTVAAVPEPITMSLLGIGGLALLRRRRA